MSRRTQTIRRAVSVAATAATACALLACGSSSSDSSASSPAAKASRDTVTTGTKAQHPFPGTGAGAVNDDNPAATGASNGSGGSATGAPSGSGGSATGAPSGSGGSAEGASASPVVVSGAELEAAVRRRKAAAANQKEPAGSAAARSFNPCTLVTRSEAEAILAHRIGKPSLAPLGPSCIYRVPASKTTVTVAVQATSFSALKSRLKKTQRKTVHGRTATCGVYGQPTTIVALSRGRVLTVAATCPVGFRFAAKALTRL